MSNSINYPQLSSLRGQPRERGARFELRNFGLSILRRGGGSVESEVTCTATHSRAHKCGMYILPKRKYQNQRTHTLIYERIICTRPAIDQMMRVCRICLCMGAASHERTHTHIHSRFIGILAVANQFGNYSRVRSRENASACSCSTPRA